MSDAPEPRAVALTAIRRGSDGAVLLGIGTDPVRGQQFCRPVGGGIEEGETPEAAARREIEEEIGRPLGEVRSLGVVDNTYVYRGRPGREIAHLFEGRFADPVLESLPEFPVKKKSLPRLARWFPIEHLGDGRVHLVPEGLRERLAGGKPEGGPIRFLAVDWSGAMVGERRRIFLAEALRGGLVRLENGRSREEVAAHLDEEARRDPGLVVGLDFAFSLPAWFLEERGLPGAPGLWAMAEKEGEEWLRSCPRPFWGRPGRKRPDLPDHLREADREVPPVAGMRPKSPFQVGGAGAVGTGSVRGMAILRILRAGGFAIWPFDPLRLPAVVEIYPRILTGRVVKSDPAARAARLGELFPAFEPEVRDHAASSEDAFDAAVSALAMDARRGELLSLPPARSRREAMEGRIFVPWREPEPQPR